MPRWLPLFSLICLSVSAVAAAQERSREDKASIGGYSVEQSPSRFRARMVGRRLSIYGLGRSRARWTRPDFLRDEAPYAASGFRLIEPMDPPASQVTRLLDRRNLLAARSPLGVSSWSALGRQYYVTDKNGEWVGASVPEIDPEEAVKRVAAIPKDGPTYSDFLAADLEKKASEHEKLGYYYFRQKKYRKARLEFGFVRQLRPDEPLPCVLDAIAACETAEYNSAAYCLVRALESKQCKTMDDLHVDWRKLYADRQSFLTTLEMLNGSARVSSSPGQNTLFAYFAWMNGDVNTAIGAARTAETVLKRAQAEAMAKQQIVFTESERGSYAKRFQDMLIEARDSQGTSKNGTSDEEPKRKPGA